jgi:hypothetical protein
MAVCCGWSYPLKAGSQAVGDCAVLPPDVCFLAANDAPHAVDVILKVPTARRLPLRDDQFPLVGMILHVRMNMQFYPSADGCLRLQFAATLSRHQFSSRSAFSATLSSASMATASCPPYRAGGRRGA